MGLLDAIFGKKEQEAGIVDQLDEANPDTKLVKWLYDTLYSNSEKWDAPYKTNRQDNVKFYKGDQWRRPQPKGKSKSITNFLSLIIRDEVAILTDSMPDINVRPVDFQADPGKATILKKIIDHVIYKNNWMELMHEGVKTTEIEGISYIYPYWDPLFGDEGDIRIIIERADNIKRDPSGEDNYFCVEKRVSMAEIKRRYPDKADSVRTEKTDQKSVNTSIDKQPPLPVQSTDGSETVTYEGTQTSVINQYDKVDLHIWWLRDESTKAIQPEGAEKIEEKPEMAPMFPHGRWITIANKKTILEDKPCMAKHFPIVPLILDFDPETKLNGISNIDYCKQLQVDYNEMQALLKDWERATVFPKFTYDQRANINPKKIRNFGSGVVGNPGGTDGRGLRWDTPPSLPNDLFSYMNILKSNIEYVSAMNDVSQGRRPASVTSAAAIRLLQEASKTVLRPKSRLLESAVKKLGELIIDYVQEGYNMPRVLKIIGVDGNMEELKINQVSVVDGVKDILNNVQIGEFDVMIEPDSTLPHSDIERFDKLIQLAQLGFVDRGAILGVSGLPNWQEIETRMAAKEAEAKAMMMAQQEQTMLEGKTRAMDMLTPGAPPQAGSEPG